MKLDLEIRKLAKTIYHQNLFSMIKDNVGLTLFKNQDDLSYAQYLYLFYLSLYNRLNMDIRMKEVSELVLKNEIFEDSYLLYVNSKKSEEKKDKKPLESKVIFDNRKRRSKNGK